MVKTLWRKWIYQYNKKYFYLNIIKFPINFYKFNKELIYFMRNGYPYSAIYDNFDWFIKVERNILKRYLKVHNSYPSHFKKSKDWENVISEMISLLDDMDETNPKYEKADLMEQYKAQKEAKENFFELFNKYFYDLWD